MKYRETLRLAREMRKNPTEAEAYMWNRVRNRRLGGYKFLRQHIIKDAKFNKREHFYIVDFYNSKNKLVIELDGKIHLRQKLSDRNREISLKEIGCQIIRFTNEEVLNSWLDVENRILTALRKPEYGF